MDIERNAEGVDISMKLSEADLRKFREQNGLETRVVWTVNKSYNIGRLMIRRQRLKSK
jgi:hypothetical protein